MGGWEGRRDSGKEGRIVGRREGGLEGRREGGLEGRMDMTVILYVHVVALRQASSSY